MNAKIWIGYNTLTNLNLGYMLIEDYNQYYSPIKLPIAFVGFAQSGDFGLDAFEIAKEIAADNSAAERLPCTDFRQYFRPGSSWAEFGLGLYAIDRLLEIDTEGKPVDGEEPIEVVWPCRKIARLIELECDEVALTLAKASA